MFGSGRDGALGWAGTFGIGVWLSVRIARWVTEAVGTQRDGGATEPVSEIVQEVLAAHRDDDTPMVQAFQAAVEEDEAEEVAGISGS
jgi:hypothetical protein